VACGSGSGSNQRLWEHVNANFRILMGCNIFLMVCNIYGSTAKLNLVIKSSLTKHMLAKLNELDSQAGMNLNVKMTVK
jgi:hypothetical protein